MPALALGPRKISKRINQCVNEHTKFFNQQINEAVERRQKELGWYFLRIWLSIFEYNLKPYEENILRQKYASELKQLACLALNFLR